MSALALRNLLGAGLILGSIFLVWFIYYFQKHHDVTYQYNMFGIKNLILGFIASLCIIGALYRFNNHQLSAGGILMAFVAICCIALILERNIKNTSILVGILIVPLQLVVSFFVIFVALGLLEKIFRRSTR